MKREVEDFIREEESQFAHDDGVVCTCDNCGGLIIRGQDMMVFIAKGGTGVRLCEKCYNNIEPDAVLELADIWNYVGDTDHAESLLNANTSKEEPT